MKNKNDNTILYSIILVGDISIILSILRRDVVWSILIFLYLILMYVLREVVKKEKEDVNLLLKDLFLWSFFPIILGGFGILEFVDPLFGFGDIPILILASIYALIILIIISNHNKATLNQPSSIFFIVSSTLSSGVILASTRFLSDLHMDTNYWEGNSHFMIYLLVITGISLFLGYIYRDYIRSSRSELFRPIQKPLLKGEFVHYNKKMIEILESLFGKKKSSKQLILVRFLQFGMIVVIVYGIIYGRQSVVGWGIFSLVTSFLPDILTLNIKRYIPTNLYLLTVFIIFLFSAGRPLGFYEIFPWWSEATHLLGGGIVTVYLLSFFLYLEKSSENLVIPNFFMPVIMLFSMLLVSVFWELSEFFIDQAFGTSLQGNVEDTALDILFNIFGMAISLQLIFFLCDLKVVKTQTILDSS